jgi:osmotically-inducible protein OsmY
MGAKTDSEVEQVVLRELSLSENVYSREICVLARDGVVQLHGSAQSDEDKLAIEETIGRAAGVVRVVNEMRVKAVVAVIKRIPMSVPLTGVVSQPC